MNPDNWGLKDVTIVGHSKGGSVVAALLEMYENGTLAKGGVKKMVAIDPPQGMFAVPFGGTPIPDALKAGTPTVSLPAQMSCNFNPPCHSAIKNDIEFPSVANNHDLQNHLAGQVFAALNISGDAHARPVLLGW